MQLWVVSYKYCDSMNQISREKVSFIADFGKKKRNKATNKTVYNYYGILLNNTYLRDYSSFCL
jgi:hypothetical protein